MSKIDADELRQALAVSQNALKIAKQALADIARWDEELEDEWSDQGERATNGLEQIASLKIRYNTDIITYEAFERAVNDLKEFFQEQDKLDAVLKVLSPSGTGVVEFGNKFIDDFIRLGEAGLKDQNNWLGWFVFDNKFGTNKLTVEFNHVEYVIANEKDFYDVFVKLSNYKQ